MAWRGRISRLLIHHSACRGRPASRSRARNQFSATSSLLNGALRINPFDVARTAAALDAALRMEPGEREGRRARDLDHVSSRPSALWTRQILDDMWTVCGRPAGAAGGGDGDTSRVLIADPDDGLGGNSGVGLREVRASLACACVARCVSCVCVCGARDARRGGGVGTDPPTVHHSFATPRGTGSCPFSQTGAPSGHRRVRIPARSPTAVRE